MVAEFIGHPSSPPPIVNDSPLHESPPTVVRKTSKKAAQPAASQRKRKNEEALPVKSTVTLDEPLAPKGKTQQRKRKKDDPETAELGDTEQPAVPLITIEFVDTAARKESHRFVTPAPPKATAPVPFEPLNKRQDETFSLCKPVVSPPLSELAQLFFNPVFCQILPGYCQSWPKRFPLSRFKSWPLDF